MIAVSVAYNEPIAHYDMTIMNVVAILQRLEFRQNNQPTTIIKWLRNKSSKLLQQ